MLSYQRRGGGLREIGTFRRYLMTGLLLGGGTLGIINKVKWRTQFIDKKQSLGENYELGQKREGKLKQLLDAISSINSWNWVELNLCWLDESEWEREI